MSAVRDNAFLGRFELGAEDDTAFADYRRAEDTLEILYVYAPPALRGTGAAGRLMEGIVGIAREEGRRLIPVCGYAAAWLERNPRT